MWKPCAFLKKMDKHNSHTKKVPDSDKIVSCFHSSPHDLKAEEDIFDTVFHCNVFSHICIKTLSKAPITPISVQTIAKQFLIHYNKPMSFLILVNRQMRVKTIEKVSMGYKAKLSEFDSDITRLCTRNKCKKCIVIYNYQYKKGKPDAVFDLDLLFRKLLENNICLVDAVCLLDNGAENIISIYNKSGYEK